MCVVVNEYMNIYINNNINDMSCIYIENRYADFRKKHSAQKHFGRAQ